MLTSSAMLRLLPSHIDITSHPIPSPLPPYPTFIYRHLGMQAQDLPLFVITHHHRFYRCYAHTRLRVVTLPTLPTTHSCTTTHVAAALLVYRYVTYHAHLARSCTTAPAIPHISFTTPFWTRRVVTVTLLFTVTTHPAFFHPAFCCSDYRFAVYVHRTCRYRIYRYRLPATVGVYAFAALLRCRLPFHAHTPHTTAPPPHTRTHAPPLPCVAVHVPLRCVVYFMRYWRFCIYGCRYYVAVPLRTPRTRLRYVTLPFAAHVYATRCTTDTRLPHLRSIRCVPHRTFACRTWVAFAAHCAATAVYVYLRVAVALPHAPRVHTYAPFACVPAVLCYAVTTTPHAACLYAVLTVL